MRKKQILRVNICNESTETSEDTKIETIYEENDELLIWAYWSILKDIHNNERLARCWKNAKTLLMVDMKAAK